eukprot:TRINITY_DN1662_c0_g2_i1.p1 TRINITY_DN1662_c0_g2~~TRINITY_DN1662_c0_g2_i1.p1  ORF type:complete len:956 (-),score=215.25 TRINITY_DN1662_c0_g2_i1:276-3143(-)
MQFALRSSALCGTRSFLLSSSTKNTTLVSLVSTRSNNGFSSLAQPLDTFEHRHLGPKSEVVNEMLGVIGEKSLDSLTSKIVPKAIQLGRPLNLHGSNKLVRGETELLQELKSIMSKNKLYKSYIGAGYAGTIIPPVILRNILENPAWYTPYTPYQGEIAQGRLESLLNYQTMIGDLTGLPYSNCSLLDEGTAAAEAVALCFSHTKQEKAAFFVSSLAHPQTIAVIKTRAEPLGIKIIVGDHTKFDFASNPVCGALIQYPASEGEVLDYSSFINAAHQHEALVVAATDLLACTLIKPPGEIGADIAIGSAQRFGVPLNYGGPHAAFFAVKDMALVRKLPGRIIGVSKDSRGKSVYRMSLQAREQHIRREKATSNICTAQALLANIAAMYAVYHGPKGLKQIAERVHALTVKLAESLSGLGYAVPHKIYFDTIRVSGSNAEKALKLAEQNGINLRKLDGGVGITLDETTTLEDVSKLVQIFATAASKTASAVSSSEPKSPLTGSAFQRTSAYLTHPVFNSHHSETEMLRYIFNLAGKDIGLHISMIPLGSCTMKLNATSEMIPVTWPEVTNIHPFAPVDQTQGYQQMFKQLEEDLSEITGFHKVSLQPNAGSQGEYAGLLVIREYFKKKGEGHRNVCLIPASAHGTNPASAVMAGMKVVVVKCDDAGFLVLDDLRQKAQENKNNLAALMITYPSTFGVFEEGVVEACKIAHENGGQVYMDGANMNAQVGLCRPGDIGADVCHLNLHKTFCIPHGGGGPGMGPIGVAKHLAEFLPGHPLVPKEAVGGNQAIGPVSAAPWGSSAILPISWMYINLMGPQGLKKASQVAILNANYMKKILEKHYHVAFHNNGFVAHEFIIDARGFCQDSECDTRGHRQETDGLQLPRTHDVMARPRHLDDRTHREREQRRARQTLPSAYQHQRGDPGDRTRQGIQGEQRPEGSTTHGGHGHLRQVGASLL